MKPAFDPHAEKHAGLFAKDVFFCVERCAGYRSVASGAAVKKAISECA